MANNIYVGGFPYKTTKEELAKLFAACGTVLSAKVILDRDTGRPKGLIGECTGAVNTGQIASSLWPFGIITLWPAKATRPRDRCFAPNRVCV